MLSVLDVDGIVAFCLENHVDGIVNFCNDPSSRSIQQVSERMGYPSIGTVNVKTFAWLFKNAA